MKKILTLILTFITIFSCNTKKKMHNTKNNLASFTKCPTNGTCSFEIIKNKSLVVKESGATGMLYTQLKDDTSKHLLKFEYKKNEEPDVMDSSYSEIVYVQIHLPLDNIKLANSNLKNATVLFEKQCFCKGEAGTYRLENGVLTISKKNNNNYSFKLDFNIDGVNQKIKSIEESFTM